MNHKYIHACEIDEHVERRIQATYSRLTGDYTDWRKAIEEPWRSLSTAIDVTGASIVIETRNNLSKRRVS